MGNSDEMNTLFRFWCAHNWLCCPSFAVHFMWAQTAVFRPFGRSYCQGNVRRRGLRLPSSHVMQFICPQVILLARVLQ